MARTKHFAVLMLIGLLSLCILTGCTSAPVQPPIVPSVPSSPSEQKTPEEIGQLFVESVQTLVKEVSQSLAEGDSLVYDKNLASAATNQLNKINADGTISPSDAFFGSASTTSIRVYTETTDGTLYAMNLTMDNMSGVIEGIRNTLKNRSSYIVYSVGVGYRVMGDNVYIAFGTVPYR